ncbi:MAG TPA: quinone-dependent dihydroorotate dehydrogenase [Flavitalea sp.]|nr:quinone-dependent dihydroorotate dehydrogenase [Flavitalea sp.]
MYRLIRSLLFLFPPENVHYFSMNSLKTICKIPIIRKWLRRRFQPVNKEVKVLGLRFHNPVGLGAGFDKNARYLSELEMLGFGFVEIGTVTPEPQRGNDKPRLFRLAQDKALINRMGFNNEGVKKIAVRLRSWQTDRNNSRRMVVGGNIGKNKQTPNEKAHEDYEICFRELADCVDYFVVNVSSPNTPGLRELQEKDALRNILSRLQFINQRRAVPVPLFLKIAPDLSESQLTDILALSDEVSLDGLVISNTTVSREGLLSRADKVQSIGSGGLSGAPLFNTSTAVLKYIHQHKKKQFVLIGSGGIFQSADAKEKIEAGAQLIQVWTGFIYEGPGIVKKISDDL